MVRPPVAGIAAAIALACALAGCKSSSEDLCGQPVACARGSWQSCVSADQTRCRYRRSDGNSVACGSCNDCQSAQQQIQQWCSGSDGTGGNGTPSSTQSPECQQYLSCAAVAAPAAFPSLVPVYGPYGSCWSDASLAASCTQACQKGLDALANGNILYAQCQPPRDMSMPPPDMSTPLPPADLALPQLPDLLPPPDMARFYGCSGMVACMTTCVPILHGVAPCRAQCNMQTSALAQQRWNDADQCGIDYCLALPAGAPAARCVRMGSQLLDAPGQPVGACHACLNEAAAPLWWNFMCATPPTADCKGSTYCATQYNVCANDSTS